MLEFLSSRLSYLGFVLFLTLCGCGIPIPEEAPLVLAGAMSANGTLEHTSLAFGACLLGALLGDSIMYAIGRHFGHAWLTTHPKISRFINAEKEQKLEHAVQRHGFKVLLLTRFLIGVRGPVYYAAGAAKVPYLRFLLWDLVSATLVVGTVFGLGYWFGPSIEKLVHEAEEFMTIIVVLVLATVGIVVFYKSQTKKMAVALENLAEKDSQDAALEHEQTDVVDSEDKV